MKRNLVLLVAVAAALLGAVEARAQLVWDAPTFLPPRPGDDIGVYLTDGDGTDLGIQGIWRQRGNLNLGLRLGLVDAPGGARAVVGVETWDMLMSAGRDLPVDLTWNLGAGATFGDGATLFSVPVGLSVGRTFDTDPATFQVYAHPRVAVVVIANDVDDRTELEPFVDIGGEMHLGTDWKLRLAFTFGEWEAFGLGLAYRWGRAVEVR